VHGCGPSGALAALALAKAGWAVQVVDPLSPEQLLSRSRAYALSHSSRELLERLGLWSPLQSAMAPFRRLELCDRALHRQVTFTLADLPGSPSPRSAVGWILQHQPLMEALLQAVRQEPGITLCLGNPVACAQVAPDASSDRAPDLVVAADGHHSPTRSAARTALRQAAQPARWVATTTR